MLALDLIRENFALLLREESMEKRDYLSAKNNIFVCGSLMDPAFVSDLLGHPVAGAFAVAMDYTRAYVEDKGQKVHFMMPGKGDVLPGMVWLDLSDEDVKKFEDFEKAPELRERRDIKVKVGDLMLDAFTYLRKD